MYKRIWTLLFCLALLAAACSPAAPAAAPTPAATTAAGPTLAPTPTAPPATAPAQAPTALASATTLVIMTHDSFAASEGVVKDFEQANHVTLQFLKSGDVGTALNKAILSKGAPLADVFYGVDNTYLSKALQADIFVPYASPALAANKIPAALQLDASQRALPVDYGDVCVNYDRAYFASQSLTCAALT